MTDKPPTTDPEQRKADTAASRRQSGLPPERETGADASTRTEPTQTADARGADARGADD